MQNTASLFTNMIIEELESSYEAQVDIIPEKYRKQTTGKWPGFMSMTERVQPTPKRVTISMPDKRCTGRENRHDTDKVGKPIRKKHGRFPADHPKTEREECGGGFRERGE